MKINILFLLACCLSCFGFEDRIRISGEIVGDARTVTVTEIESTALSGNGELIRVHTAVIDKKETSSFSGVLLTDFIKRYGVRNVKSITVKAWDRYVITLDMEKIKKFSPILVTREQGKHIPYEERGPVRIVTPTVQSMPDQIKDRVQIFSVKEIIFNR